jgi:hypothetical protein
MEKISEIWIVNKSGAPLFNRSNDTKVDPALFGGFLSAIQGFIETSFSGLHLQTLVFGESQLIFLYIDPYQMFIVVRCPKKINVKDVQAGLEKIRDLFLGKFKTVLEKAAPDLDEFLSFNADLDKILEAPKMVKRMTNWFEEVK